MFDLSKFQKIAEDKDSTTLRHKDGHEMRIVHAFIPKIQKEQLKRLALAKGGPVNYSNGFNPSQSQVAGPNISTGGGSSPQVNSKGFEKIGNSIGKKLKGSPQKDAPLEGDAGQGTGGQAEGDSAFGGQNAPSDTMQQASPNQQVSSNDAFNDAMEESLAEGGEVGKKREEREKNKDYSTPAGTTENYHKTGKNTPIGKMQREEDLKKYRKSKGPDIKGLAEGGEVHHYADESGSPSDAVVSNDQPQAPVNNITIHAAPAPQQNPAVAYGNQQPNVQVPNVPTPLPNISETGQPNPGNIEKNLQTQGTAQRDIDIAKGQAIADTEAGYLQATKQNQQQAQDLYTNMDTHVKDYAKYINENPISADHYFQQNGLGKRAVAMFSIALGNVSQHGNPALEYINNQINRDMQSQIENSHNQKNILSAYEQLYGKGVAANAATKATILDLYTHKANQVAALLGTPQAKVNAMKFGTAAAIDGSKSLQDAAIQLSSIPGYTGGTQQPSGQVTPPALQQNGAQSQPSSGGFFSPPSAQAAPVNPQKYNKSEDQILSSGAIENSIGLQKNPLVNHEKFQSQLTQADQAEKTLMGPDKNGVGGLNDVMTKLDKLAKEGGSVGYIRRHNPLGHIPIVGGIAQSMGDAATANPTNKDYDSLRTALYQDIRNALPGDVSDARIQDILDSQSPEPGDPPELLQKKTDRIRQFIKKSLRTDELEKWHAIPGKKTQ